MRREWRRLRRLADHFHEAMPTIDILLGKEFLFKA